MNIRKIHGEPSSHKGFWQYFAFASVAIPTALVSYCFVTDKNPNDELQNVSAVVSQINDDFSSAVNVALANYHVLDKKVSAGISSAFDSFIDNISFSSPEIKIENKFGFSTADLKRFISHPEAVILKHWKKDYYGADFEKAVDEKVEEAKPLIKYYSGCFSELTKYDDFIAAGLKNSKYVSESFARSMIVAESCSDLYARSPKKAIGPAQYIKPTALEDSIEINKYVDYRRHPSAITKGIMRLDKLAEDYNGDIMLALIGYNACKEKFCDGIINKYGPDYLWQDIKKFIRPETEKYLPIVFALNRMYENREENGLKIKKMPLFSDQIKKEHEVRKNENIFKIAKAYGVPLKRISMVNPQLNNHIIKEGMVVYIPY